MLVSDFHFDLPEDLIAQEPLADRSASRMLHLHRSSGAISDDSFAHLPALLRPDDLVVLNNTRVFPARLLGHRRGARAQPVSPRNPAARDFLQGRVEVLLTRRLSADPNEWMCLVRPGRKIGVGEVLSFGDRDQLQAEVLARGSFGERHIRFAPVANFHSLLESLGRIPLPPYIARHDRGSDRERYQTVYARESGSVAAPTAGLHFTPEIFSALHDRGIQTAEVTLHIGLGTFAPVRVEQVEDHRMHAERYSISPSAAALIQNARDAKRRVVAVGTTTVRTLEHAASASPDGRIRAGDAEAEIFIYPGYSFRAVGALLTNFHLPQSTLLMLVSAFASRDVVLAAYRHAVAQRYRFYSYGDCMFVE